MSNFFAIPITDEWGTTYQLTTAGYTALVVLMLALLLVAIIAGCAYGFNYLASNAAYLVAQDGKVAVYQGVPGDIFGFSFNHLDRVTDVALDDLQPGTANRLREEGIKVDSLEAANSLVAEYEKEIADRKAAEEEAARQAEEQRKAAARHIEAQTFSVDLPEYWDGRVTAKVEGDSICLYSTAHPDKYIGSLAGYDHEAQVGGDVSGSLVKDINLGGGRYVEIWIRRWAYDAAMSHLSKYSSSSSICSDDAARETLDLQSLGAISFDTIVSEMKAADTPESKTLFKADDIFANALAPTVKPL